LPGPAQAFQSAAAISRAWERMRAVTAFTCPLPPGEAESGEG
jgi:hypothetical protein